MGRLEDSKKKNCTSYIDAPLQTDKIGESISIFQKNHFSRKGNPIFFYELSDRRNLQDEKLD